ncbi:MAG: MarR family winged helix-turn-helix transcriptional regulator [Bacteroidota bacterium]
MDDVITLLQDYRDFKKTDSHAGFAEFGTWLQQKHATASTLSVDRPNKIEKGPEYTVGYLLGGLSSFVETWVKLAFQDVPLGSLQDYGILKSVEHVGNPTKKQLADEIVAERTTVIESIKRLTKEGLLWETPDDQDRRLRRVMLTDQGVDMITLADRKMAALENLLVGDLSEDDQRGLLPALGRLFDFHQHLYYHQAKEKVKENYSL